MRAPALAEGEAITYSVTANRRSSAGGRSVGGRLFITDRRVIHRAGTADRLFGAATFECDRAAVVAVEEEGRFKSLVRTAGTTVAITLESGEVVRFVVWGGMDLVAALA